MGNKTSAKSKKRPVDIDTAITDFFMYSYVNFECWKSSPKVLKPLLQKSFTDIPDLVVVDETEPYCLKIKGFPEEGLFNEISVKCVEENLETSLMKDGQLKFLPQLGYFNVARFFSLCQLEEEIRHLYLFACNTASRVQGHRDRKLETTLVEEEELECILEDIKYLYVAPT